VEKKGGKRHAEEGEVKPVARNPLPLLRLLLPPPK